ncbi:DUF2934 domain-containing protein [Caballeronia grimmiae]|uniref:DUF2934 domain-containing protein n=1 Tax=Caballeronia grimmiae TaxID=1071679 RepID=A0A069NI01_9BURK|nr:DUF2934 domain-containing protein [Caballeronia grimmiae]KDR27204.1 hypothetical protein BG57_23485 [Caballeronia grimmiae]GGD69956.1 hypothetical protein GCM10010985_25600 [Caballeronia grimmiae]
MQEKSKEEAIRERAYRLWEADECREGSADYYWYLAIELLDEEAQFSKEMSQSLLASANARQHSPTTGQNGAPKDTAGTDAPGEGALGPKDKERTTRAAQRSKAKASSPKATGVGAGRRNAVT